MTPTDLRALLDEGDQVVSRLRTLVLALDVPTVADIEPFLDLIVQTVELLPEVLTACRDLVEENAALRAKVERVQLQIHKCRVISNLYVSKVLDMIEAALSPAPPKEDVT